MFRKFLIGALALLISLTPFVTVPSSTAATAPLTNSQASAKWGGDQFPATGLWLLENLVLGFNQSALYSAKTNNTPITELLLCDSLQDVNCDSQSELYQILNLDICTPDRTLSCIAGIWAIDPNGKRIDGEVVRSVSFDEKQFVQENLPLKLPQSTSYGTVWKVPGVINGAGNDNYFAATSVTMFKQPSENTFSYGEIESGIIPINELRGNYGVRTLIPTGGHGSNGSTRSPSGEECIAAELGICRERVEFPTGYRFGMTLNIGEKLSGWYHGRLSLPDISIKDWQQGQSISVEGEPVKVPSLDFVVPNDELSPTAKKVIENCDSKKVHCGGRGNATGIRQFVGNLNHPETFEWLKAFNSDYQDKSTKTQTFWSFKRMFNHAGLLREDELKRCGEKAGSLIGLVLTNSLAYSSGPPAYEKQSGALVYSVASPHYESNGEVASGTYDLTLRSEVARCIYGFSNAPIKAEISITGDDGEKRVATTVVREKDGWLYLSAQGFTFSSPTIQVKLTQEVVEKIAENTPADPIKVASPKIVSAKKKISITCAKGKSIKKVSGTSPKCPKGFTRK